MNQVQLPPKFSADLREALINRIDAEMAPRARRRRALWMGLIVAGGVGLLGGAGVATAAFLIQPGGVEVAELMTPFSVTRTGTATVQLGDAPEGATNIRLSLVCLSAGTFSFPDGASVSCSDSDATGPVRLRTTTHSIPLESNQNSVTINTSSDATWTLTATYSSERVTDWAVNSNGYSYGAMNENGTPDLIAVIATNGKQGYVFAADLAHADGSDQNFTSPEQALKWQRERQGKTFSITVYLSDGKTPIGTFTIAG